MSNFTYLDDVSESLDRHAGWAGGHSCGDAGHVVLIKEVCRDAGNLGINLFASLDFTSLYMKFSYKNIC